jgi:peptidoglycan/LPS O-acetylase OafA/YrhL
MDAKIRVTARPYTTFGLILDEHAGSAPGFDFVRLFLATSIVVYHAVFYTRPPEEIGRILSGPAAAFINMLVPAFFALSGFLVTGSLLRLKNIKKFVALRILRILPALLVEVSLSAIVLGSAVTDIPLRQYFADAQLYSYFCNIVGFIHYQLPGVFKHQYRDIVNGSLWTIPGEICCYLSLVGLMIVGISHRRWLMLSCFIVATIVTYLWTRQSGAFSTQHWLPLVFCFYAGSLLFHFKDKTPSSWAIAVAALLAFTLIFYFRYGLYIVFGPSLVAYAVCYFGTKELPHIRYLMDGDHSYGIYLYHAPIIQTVVWAIGMNISAITCFAISFPIVVGFSMASWLFIEKPALGLRRKII